MHVLLRLTAGLTTLTVLQGMSSPPAFAQPSAPDAGALLRESERSLQAPRNAPTPLASAPVARPMPEDDKEARITVQQLRIAGNSLIPLSELQPLVADRLGQSLTLAELEQAAQRIAEHYRTHGWYVRVYLPQQDVTDGSVLLQVLEGRYGGSRIDAQSPHVRANAAQVEATINHRLQPGAPLSAADLERGLLLSNDLPGIYATGVLLAGKQQGEIMLNVSVQDTPWISADIGLNNHGVPSTGRTQAVGGVALNNLSGSGDQLALRLLAAQDIRSAVLRYALPLGHDGLRLTAHASTLDYELGGRYRALQAEGTAHTVGLALSYPLVRQATQNLTLSAGYEHRRYADDMLDTPLRRHRIHAIHLGANGDWQDAWGGGGINWGSMQLTHGRLALRDVNGDPAIDAATARTAGSYTRLAWSLNRLHNLGSSMGGSWQVQAALSGQLASGNLASSERMTLGGPSQLRAYPVNEASGDAGVLLQLELLRQLSPGWQALVFYDAGYIRQHQRPWAGWNADSGQPNSYRLSGAGLGLRWQHRQWQLSASIAKPLGRNPGQSADGHNNDGSRARSLRGWLAVSYLL